MQIEIPQYIWAEVEPYDEMNWHAPKTKKVFVYIGSALVFTHETEFYTEDGEAIMEAVTAFGKSLALKIGN